VSKAIAGLPASDSFIEVRCASALDWSPADPVIISTDPPYYDMFDYAALANYFYTWIRLTLADIWPDVCGPLLSPTDDQLVSNSGRFGGDREAGRTHFETMLAECFERFRSLQDDHYPLTLYYGYQQSERRDGGRVSTAWESMLASLLNAGFVIKSTWPVRTERPEGVKSSSNALASSVVLVCRRRPVAAPVASRREFVQALKSELPDAVRLLQQGNIAPVDLAQSAIGPGMAVFSRYAHVVNVDGSSMRVGDALGIINQILDETLAEQEADFDSDTRWAIAWFDQFGNEAAPYGVAETLSKAKNTSLGRLQEAGIVEAKAGKVRLLTQGPTHSVAPPSRSMPIWIATHRLAQALERDGEPGAAAVLASITIGRELVRELAYRLYNICDQKKRPKAGLRYNALVASWPEVNRLAQQQGAPNAQQVSLL
jgi:putative DNA methylase